MNFIADSLLLGTLSGVRDFEALHFQTCTEPIRLFIISNFPSIVEDELAGLQQRAAPKKPLKPALPLDLHLSIIKD